MPYTPPEMKIVLGIDGGGSRTRAALMNEDGRVIGTGEAGPSNLHAVPRETATENIRLAVQNARSAANISAAGEFAAAFLGMAGVGTERERRVIRQIAAELKLAPKNRIGVDHDIRIALAGALAGRDGIVLIAGTGSACYGRRESARGGRDARAGGWGSVLDDAGSGFWLGLQAMKAILRAEDGRAPKTTLRRILFTALKIKSPRELIALAANPAARAQIAALAPPVIRAAKAGDPAAKRIVATGAAELALLVHTVAKRLKFSRRVSIAIAGGLSIQTPYVSAIHRELKKRMPSCEIVKAIQPPMVGAAILAMRLFP